MVSGLDRFYPVTRDQERLAGGVKYGMTQKPRMGERWLGGGGGRGGGGRESHWCADRLSTEPIYRGVSLAYRGYQGNPSLSERRPRSF